MITEKLNKNFKFLAMAVAALVASMEHSINEANAFISTMEK